MKKWQTAVDVSSGTIFESIRSQPVADGRDRCCPCFYWGRSRLVLIDNTTEQLDIDLVPAQITQAIKLDIEPLLNQSKYNIVQIIADARHRAPQDQGFQTYSQSLSFDRIRPRIGTILVG